MLAALRRESGGRRLGHGGAALGTGKAGLWGSVSSPDGGLLGRASLTAQLFSVFLSRYVVALHKLHGVAVCRERLTRGG